MSSPEAKQLDPAVLSELKPVQAELAQEFHGIFSRETVGEFVLEAGTMFHHPDIATHVPDLVRRYARDILQSLARTRGYLPKGPPEVLFVCVKNAGRSQMAAAFLAHHAKGQLVARCVGTEPAETIDARVVQVMSEAGIPMSGAFPKPLHRHLVEGADVIVTMGCGDACPIVPGRLYEDWALPDPAGMPLERLRELRDEVENRTRQLIQRLQAMSPCGV